MTLNELIAKLQELQAAGHGDVEVATFQEESANAPIATVDLVETEDDSSFACWVPDDVPFVSVPLVVIGKIY